MGGAGGVGGVEGLVESKLEWKGGVEAEEDSEGWGLF